MHFNAGGDYKFLLCVLGLNAAMSTWSCAYCYVHKDFRAACDHEMVQSDQMLRTLDQLKSTPTSDKKRKQPAAKGGPRRKKKATAANDDDDDLDFGNCVEAGSRVRTSGPEGPTTFGKVF